MNSGPMFPEPDFYAVSDAGGEGGGGKGKMIVAGLAVVIIIAIIAYMLWPSTTPSPSPSPSPDGPSAPPWKPYCTFNASGTNKDNFNVASDSGMELFPIDRAKSEYNQLFEYDGSGNILTCKVNASTKSPEFAPSGPTALGYTFPTISHPETLVPNDGTTTKTDSVCTWNPKSNICNTPICSLGESYNIDVSNLYKKQGIKQYLSQDELDTFIDGLSCHNGQKYGQCSGTPTKCSISGKQNNKINCLGNCSGDPNKVTKEDCEKYSKNEWVYEPEKSQCKYESLDKPPIKISNIPQISSGEYQGKYKMCDNPGDFVNLDSIVDTCSKNCYPNPINEHNPDNRNEMPLSWTNKCGFTDITNQIFTTSSYHISPCANHAVFKGNVYYNICDKNCSEVKSDIQTNIPSASPIPPPCQGGGDIFDVYNNCSSASCDNIFSRSATSSSTLAQCPDNKTRKSSSPGTDSAISLPPASDCNPDSPKKFSLNDYLSKAKDNCCVNKTCDDEYPTCPKGYSKASPSPSPSPGSSGNTLQLQDCCVLETCSEYVTGTGNNKCVEGTTRTAGSDNTYVLPTCCIGYIQITITLKRNININKFMQLSHTYMKSPLTNVFPSYILKQLLKPSSPITLNSINPTSIDPSTDNLYFINNQTTFMELHTNKQTMDNTFTQKYGGQDYQRTNIPKMGNKNEYNFYILTSQKYDSKSKINSVISFNISEAYTTVKNITDIISNSDSDQNISEINASLTDCSSIKGICDIIPRNPYADQVLNGVNSYCCMKSTCGNMLTQDQKNKLSDTPSSVHMPGWKACGGGTYFDGDSPWTPGTTISGINASNQCCVSGNITAYKPDTSDKTITDLYKTYVTKKNPGDKDILLPPSIDFKWVNNKFEIASNDKYMNASLADIYKCMYNASIPEYAVSKHSNGTYYYKLTGCEDGDNMFCKIPNSHKEAPSGDDTYDASIYDLTGLMESNEGSYISMYATAQGGSESKHEGDIMANYGGIVCTSDPYETVDLKPCDKPYDYIKFSGCNTYFPGSDEYQFYTRTASPEDCLGLTEYSCKNDDYENLCIWEENKCSPLPFPTYGQQVGVNCGVKLNAADNFSDAFWLKEGFQNYKNQEYKGITKKKGDSTRIIQTPSPSPGSAGPSASSREVSRRTNYCGYKPKSQKGDTDQFHSRVVDSTWMCKDKTCKGDNLKIKLPKDDTSNLKSFTSYINGDPLIYEWGVNENTNTVSNKKFYDDKYNIVNGSFTFDDYRPVQGEPLTSFNLTDRYACVNKDKPSEHCARPTASHAGAKPACDPSCTLTPISSDINDLNSGDNVNDRITRFTKIQNIGEADYNASQMEYVHNNIKYHNNYATMCGDNKYLSFFDFENENGENYQKCTPCRYQRDPYPPSPPPPNTYNEFYTTELKKLKSDEQSYMNQHVYPKSSDASKPVFLSGVISPSSTSSDCSGGQSKATNEIDGWDKCKTIKGKDNCNNSFYFWPKTDKSFPGTDEYYNCLYNEGKNECESPKNSQPCKNTDKITEKTNNYCCYTPTSTLTSTSSSPPPSSPSNFIINETSPDKGDKNKMSNCSVNSSPSKRTKIPIGEYSTHFVPWWRETSATDLKITDGSNFTALSNQLKPNSSSINIPTCDLHKDRCEDIKTQTGCNMNASHSWSSPSSTGFNMCKWSDNKCTTNPDWRNDQSMCGHPCLSRIDAKPRKCTLSDDCEIRDRYNFSAFSGIVGSPVTMYCDSDGRNPILYGTAEDSKYESNAMQKDYYGYCNKGYYLIDLGSSVNTGGSKKSFYKCLSCDELNSYLVDGDSSGNTGASPMVNAFETYINACGTSSQKKQLKNSGSWKVKSDGKCGKGVGNCTAFVWPSSQNSAANPNFLTGKKEYTSQDVLYTQDTIVADQYIKSKILASDYSDCLDPNKGNLNMHSADCKTYVSAMEKVLGLSTRDYDTDHKFKGYNASQTINDIGIDFGNCDYNTKPIMAKWGTDSTSQKISVNAGGMVASTSYNKGTTDLDKLILAGHLCPQRKYLANGRPSEDPKEYISMNDRYWPAITKKGNKEYTYCKPLLGLGEECNSREEGKISCAPLGVASKGDNNSLSKYTPGYCGKNYSGGGELKDKPPYYCLGALKAGSPCDSNSGGGEDLQCSDWQQGWFADGSPMIYGADCYHQFPGTQRHCRGSGPILNNEPKK